MVHPSADKPVAVVTGASSGIGYATVKALVARGFYVVATMRNVQKAPGDLNADANVVLHPLDVTSDESVAALAAWLRDDSNVTRLDVVVNNAGYGVPGTVETLPLDVAKSVFEVNVWGPVRVCKALIPIMRQRGHGGLLATVSSIAGVRAEVCTNFYAGSKYA
jgi:NAD(P)-dependent dehydrogenase (short-subunit alcohol dehydrogenase family)